MSTNWNPSNIFDARAAGAVIDRDQKVIGVRLYSDGWAMWHTTEFPNRLNVEGLDVWTACKLLNDYQAVIYPS